MDIRRALKQKGIEQAQVIRNLLYLIEYRWVREEVEQGQIRRGNGFFPTTSKKYIITNQGMELFDEKSKFARPDGVAGIRIENVSGIVVVGNNNFARQEFFSLFKSLEELTDKIRLTDQLTDEKKVEYSAEVKTIQDQLAKPKPDKGIISKAWGALRFVGTLGSVANVWEKVKIGLEQAFGSLPPPI